MPRFVLILVVLASLASPAAPARAAGPCLLGQDLPAGFRAFAPDSPWNAPIAAKAAVDPQSGAMIHSLAARGGPLAPSTRKWTVPVFVIDAKNCPTVSVPTRSDVLHPSVDPDGDRRADLPLPEGVWPDPSEDAHMVMVDPRAGKAWELSGVRLAGGRVASANRIYVWDLSGPGFVKPPFSGSAWWAVGATAAGLPLIGGVVGLAEFEAGRIDHALIGGVPNTRKSRQPGGPLELCPPASRTDGQTVGTDTIPLGARLQLDPALDLASLGLSARALPLAKAMQRHGIIVGVTADTFKIFLQNRGADGAAWKPYNLSAELAKIPVTSFRVLACPLAVKGGQ